MLFTIALSITNVILIFQVLSFKECGERTPRFHYSSDRNYLNELTNLFKAYCFLLCKMRIVFRLDGLRSLYSPKLKDSSYFKKSLNIVYATNDQAIFMHSKFSNP